jgi:hypothetical protein
MKQFSEFGINAGNNFTGDKLKIDKIINREVTILKHKIEDSKYPKNKSGKCLTLQIEINDTKSVVFTGSDVLINQIQQVPENEFPFSTTIIKSNDHFEFS